MMDEFLKHFAPEGALDDIVQQQIGAVKKIVEDGTQELLPILFARCVHSQTQEAGVHIVGLADMPEDPDEKRELMRGVAAKFTREHLIPTDVSLVSEAWMKSVSAHEYQRAKHTGMPRPSECLDRKEVVQVSGLSVSRRALSFMAPIRRDDENRILLGEFEEMGGEMRCYLLEQFFAGVLEQLQRNIRDREGDRN